jgi:hypothetical protein
LRRIARSHSKDGTLADSRGSVGAPPGAD